MIISHSEELLQKNKHALKAPRMLKIDLVPGNISTLKRSLASKPPKTCTGAKERKLKATSVLEASLLALDELRTPLNTTVLSALNDKLGNSRNKCSKTQLADICCRSLDALEALEKPSGMPPLELEKRQCNTILKLISADLVEVSFQLILHLKDRLLAHICPYDDRKSSDSSSEDVLVIDTSNGSLSTPIVNLVVMYHLLVLKCCARAKDQSSLPISLTLITKGFESPNGPLSWCDRLDEDLSREKRKIMADTVWTLHHLGSAETSLDICFLAFEISPNKGKISKCLLNVLRSKISHSSIPGSLLYEILASKIGTFSGLLNEDLPGIPSDFYIFTACLALEVGKVEDSERWLSVYESIDKTSTLGNLSVIMDIARVYQKTNSATWLKFFERFNNILEYADLSEEDPSTHSSSGDIAIRSLDGAMRTLVSGFIPDVHIASKVMLLLLSEYLRFGHVYPNMLTPQHVRTVLSSCGSFLKKSSFTDDMLTMKILERCETLVNFNKENETSSIISNLYFNFGVSLWNRKLHNEAVSAWLQSVNTHFDINSDINGVKKLEKLAFGYSAIGEYGKSNDYLKSAMIWRHSRPNPDDHNGEFGGRELTNCDDLLIRYLDNLRSLFSNGSCPDDLLSGCLPDLRSKILYRLFQLNTEGKDSEKRTHLTNYLTKNIFQLIRFDGGTLADARISVLLLWDDQLLDPELRAEWNKKGLEYVVGDTCEDNCKDVSQFYHKIIYCACAMYIGVLKFSSESPSLDFISKAINCFPILCRFPASRISRPLYDIFPEFTIWLTVFCAFLEKNGLQTELIESLNFLSHIRNQNAPATRFPPDLCTTVIEVTEPDFLSNRQEKIPRRPFEMTIWTFLNRTESMLLAGKLDKAVHEFSVLYSDLDKIKIPDTVTMSSFSIVARRYLTKAYAYRVLSSLSQKKGNLEISMAAAKSAYRLYLKISISKNTSLEKRGRDMVFHSQRDLVSWSAFQGVFSSLIQLGDVYSSCGSVREAQYYYSEALKMAECDYAHLKAVFACTRLHFLYLHAGYKDKAEDIIKRLSFDDVVLLGRPLLSMVYNCHGLHKTYYQDYEAGLSFYRKALEVQAHSESIKNITFDGSAELSSADDNRLNASMNMDLDVRTIKLYTLLGMVENLLYQANFKQTRLVLEEARHLSCYLEDEGYLNMLYSALAFEEASEILMADPLYNVIHESALSYPNAIASPMPKSVPKQQVGQKKQTRKATSIKRLANEHGNVNALLVINKACDILSNEFPNVCQYIPSHIGSKLASAVTRLCSLRSSLSINRSALELIATIYTEELCRTSSLVKEVKWDDKHMLERVVAGDLGPKRELKLKVKDFKHLYTDIIPKDWLVVSISYCKVTQNLVLTRFDNVDEPFVLRLPLNRQSSRNPDESDFLFDEVSTMFHELIAASNQTTHMAKTSKVNIDKKSWWKERYQLDANLAELLRSMELLWFGGFTGIFDAWLLSDDGSLLQFQTIMCNILSRHLTSRSDSRTKGKKGKKILIDPRVFQLFLAFGKPDKRVDQENYSDALEDLVYFVLDILQFHGEYNAYDELDIDEVIVEMSGAIEAFYQEKAIESRLRPLKHTVLILDKSVHSFPWESMPCLRKNSVSRMPSMESLCDILRRRRYCNKDFEAEPSGYFVLNPGKDLAKTQATFEPVLQSLQTMHGPDCWSGVIGSAPDPTELREKVESGSIYLYFGHGGGEHYLGSGALKRMEKCGAAFLFGCSSGALKDAGEYDAWGTPLAYLYAGSPAIVANLWDVTDKDIDRFSLATFKRWGLTHQDDDNMNKIKKGIQQLHISGNNDDDDQILPPPNKFTIAEAVAQSRDDCILPYLNGAAPVIYGVPLTLIDRP